MATQATKAAIKAVFRALALTPKFNPVAKGEPLYAEYRAEVTSGVIVYWWVSATIDLEEGYTYYNLCGEVRKDGRHYKVHHEGTISGDELVQLATDAVTFLRRYM